MSQTTATANPTVAGKGAAIYAQITRDVTEASIELRGRRPLFVASEDGRRFTATWKIDHRLRLTRTITYQRSDGTSCFETTNRLVTSTGDTLGLTSSSEHGVQRYNQVNFVNHIVLTLAYTANDIQVRGLLSLADREPKPEFRTA
ncbi:hypothetical protein [Corynebacterium sp. AOP12-C2-36]|uniref:hypothetical protein n=1 Tax=Corynebacterium sp. AOP12-C2-36 TaxID=3457723 RepID=UPI0040335AA0